MTGSDGGPRGALSRAAFRGVAPGAILRVAFLAVLSIGLSLAMTACRRSPAGPVRAAPEGPVADPAVADLIGRFSEAEMRRTVEALQGFASRTLGQAGNRRAAEYLHGRFSAIPGLAVEYQDDKLRNVIATLPGTDPAARTMYIVGAHYDSAGPTADVAPGAMDDATGVAVVLEVARLASGERFRHPLVFACLNGEECGLLGSTSYVEHLKAAKMQVGLYLNYDSTGYDPEDRRVLDVIASPGAADLKERLMLHNRLYGLGFTIVENRHGCGGDHVPFVKAGYAAISTHQEEHGPHYHGADDRIEFVTFRYALRNGQLGLSLLAHLAR
jgi:Zn-dependent M28 family amino/carboxypeptidase